MLLVEKSFLVLASPYFLHLGSENVSIKITVFSNEISLLLPTLTWMMRMSCASWVNFQVTVVVQLKNCNKEYCTKRCRPTNSPLLFLLTLSLMKSCCSSGCSPRRRGPRWRWAGPLAWEISVCGARPSTQLWGTTYLPLKISEWSKKMFDEEKQSKYILNKEKCCACL